MSELKQQCPLLEKCKKASQIYCTDRDYINCDFFKNLISTNCDRLLSKCVKCKYTKECTRPNNITKPKRNPSIHNQKPQSYPIAHDYKEEFRMPER
jgi:hypothetical protein